MLKICVKLLKSLQGKVSTTSQESRPSLSTFTVCQNGQSHQLQCQREGPGRIKRLDCVVLLNCCCVAVSVVHSVADRHLLSLAIAIHLRDLVRHVKTTNWYGLGLELGVDDYTLDLIHEDQRGDNRAQLRRMFQEWLRESEEPTWEAVVQALTAIGEDTLASEIEEQFL